VESSGIPHPFLRKGWDTRRVSPRIGVRGGRTGVVLIRARVGQTENRTLRSVGLGAVESSGIPHPFLRKGWDTRRVSPRIGVRGGRTGVVLIRARVGQTENRTLRSVGLGAVESSGIAHPFLRKGRGTRHLARVIGLRTAILQTCRRVWLCRARRASGRS
jgi:hypothetical protein